MSTNKFKNKELTNDLEKNESFYRRLIKKQNAPSNAFCNLGII